MDEWDEHILGMIHAHPSNNAMNFSTDVRWKGRTPATRIVIKSFQWECSLSVYNKLSSPALLVGIAQLFENKEVNAVRVDGINSRVIWLILIFLPFIEPERKKLLSSCLSVFGCPDEPEEEQKSFQFGLHQNFLLNFKSGWVESIRSLIAWLLAELQFNWVRSRLNRSRDFGSFAAPLLMLSPPTNWSALSSWREWRGQLNTLLYIASQFQEAVKTSSTVHLKAGFSTEIKMINWCTLEERTARSDSQQEKEKTRKVDEFQISCHLNSFSSHCVQKHILSTKLIFLLSPSDMAKWRLMRARHTRKKEEFIRE